MCSNACKQYFHSIWSELDGYARDNKEPSLIEYAIE